MVAAVFITQGALAPVEMAPQQWGCTESDTTEVTQQQQQQSPYISPPRALCPLCFVPAIKGDWSSSRQMMS